MKRPAFHVQRKAKPAYAKCVNHFKLLVLFADLVSDRAGSLACRLARGLTFAAADMFVVVLFLQVAGENSSYVFHLNHPFYLEFSKAQ